MEKKSGCFSAEPRSRNTAIDPEEFGVVTAAGRLEVVDVSGDRAGIKTRRPDAWQSCRSSTELDHLYSLASSSLGRGSVSERW
jgi:hypothetical protein